ncbi:hypothetical protein JW962_02705 [Candidatus Dojkabacteria bacterium]|nr:hypothetical protein [Candidatus Dojkabacteria bacterium]
MEELPFELSGYKVLDGCPLVTGTVVPFVDPAGKITFRKVLDSFSANGDGEFVVGDQVVFTESARRHNSTPGNVGIITENTQECCSNDLQSSVCTFSARTSSDKFHGVRANEVLFLRTTFEPGDVILVPVENPESGEVEFREMILQVINGSTVTRGDQIIVVRNSCDLEELAGKVGTFDCRAESGGYFITFQGQSDSVYVMGQNLLVLGIAPVEE